MQFPSNSPASKPVPFLPRDAQGRPPPVSWRDESCAWGGRSPWLGAWPRCLSCAHHGDPLCVLVASPTPPAAGWTQPMQPRPLETLLPDLERRAA